MKKVELYDPLKKSEPNKRSLITASDNKSSLSGNRGVPLSPMSGRPMQLVEGANMGKTFKMWAHLQDRITLPYYGE